MGKTGFILSEIGFDLKEFIDPIPHRRTQAHSHTYTNLHTQATSFIAVKAQIKRIFDFRLGEMYACRKLLVNVYERKQHLASIVHVERKFYKIKATNTILVRTELNCWCTCVCADLFLPKEINGGDGEVGWKKKRAISKQYVWCVSK